VRREFLAKRHIGYDSFKIVTGFLVRGRYECNRDETRPVPVEGPAPSSPEVEQTTEFFVSMAARSHLSGAAVFLCVWVCGAAVLTRYDRPAIRAVLWEGVPTLSDSDAKPPARTHQRRKGGSGGGRRPPRGSEVGNALRAAYNDALKEEIPPDLLALLGKLD
jgi:hypothetical protein